jgi:hypothetical protein
LKTRPPKHQPENCHLGNIAYRLGRKLHIGTTSESFINDPEADAMLTRDYRAPFFVPARI